jgi:hypothetical protein
MSGTKSGGEPDDGLSASWTSESLPMSVRRQLLERELNKLGFRKTEAGRAVAAEDGQQEGQSSHPQADGSNQHGD